MGEAFDVSQLSEEEIQAAMDRGDLTLEQGFDDEGEDMEQYELTEQGRLRVMNNILVSVLVDCVEAHKQGKAYNKVITYMKNVLAHLQPDQRGATNLGPASMVPEEAEDEAALVKSEA